MSNKHHKYSQRYNKPYVTAPVETINDTFVFANDVNITPVDTDPEPTASEASTPEPVYGTVAGCKALNIREEASVDSEKVCVLPAGSRVVIENINRAGEWMSICTEAGLEGYCLSEFIKID